MIKLKDLLKEFEYGDKLWAEPQGGVGIAPSSNRYRDFIKKIYNDDIEYNTPEEEAVLKAVASYIEHNDKTVVNPYVNDLFQLKKKFPDILDPKSSSKTGDKLYRGMTAHADTIVKYIESAKSIEEVTVDDFALVSRGKHKWIYLKGINAVVKSRNKAGFISLTTSIESAALFGSFASDRCPVITETPYTGIASSVIWNPEYLATLSNYAEEMEVWCLGNSIPSTNIYIVKSYDASYLNTEEGEKISKALNDRLQTDKDKAEIS